MIPAEVLKKIRRIQIRTSHQVDALLAGTWHSAFKGRGIEFEEVRPYSIGDDVRSIDWNVTARTDQPYIKLFREERELAVMMLVDISGSLEIGTHHQTKRELVTELGATLAFSAIKNNDSVGLTLFSSTIEKSIRPRKGPRHVLRLIRELLYTDPIGTGTNLQVALQHFERTTKRHQVVFIISDFQDEGFEQALRVTRRRHDLIPVIVVDAIERELPNVGLVRVRDVETGASVMIDTGSRRVRKEYADRCRQRHATRMAMFRRLRLEPLVLETGQDIVEPLRHYFHRRESSR
jgi:uncharacterized protein (DUF58 family)